MSLSEYQPIVNPEVDGFLLFPGYTSPQNMCIVSVLIAV
jgi:hypothetical protein